MTTKKPTWRQRFTTALRRDAHTYSHAALDVEIDDLCEALDVAVLDVANDGTFDVMALLSGDLVACLRPDTSGDHCRWAVYAL